MTNPNPTTTVSSKDLHAELRELADRTLSPHARYGHLALLLAASAMAVLVVSLMVTEPALPPRTQLAFAVLIFVALSWVAYAAWVLSKRRPLFQQHRVVSASMATAFSAVFTVVTAAAAWFTGSAAAFMASIWGAGLVVVAASLLVRSRSRRNALLERRDALMSALGTEA